MRMKKTWMVVLMMVLCVMFTSSAWAAGYKVGFIASVTGASSFLGQPQKETAQMVQDWINSSGGINGVPLELIYEDSKSMEADGLLLTKKLIEKDHVLAIIGDTMTGVSMAMVPICTKAEMPMISMASALAIVTPEDEIDRINASPKPWLESPKKQRYWIFKTANTDTSVAEKMWMYCVAKKYKKIGLITISLANGQQGRQQLKRMAPKYGMEIVADEVYAPTDTDMTAQLTKIRAAGAQAVINWSVGPPQVIVTKNWSDLGMRGKIPLIHSHGFGNKDYIRLSGGAAEGIIVPLGRVLYAEKIDPKHPQKAVLTKYKTEYEKRYKKDVTTFGGHAYDGVMLVADALKAVGPNKKKIRDYLENNVKNWPGIDGVFNFSPTDHCGYWAEALEMVEVVNGDWELAK
jgi:branched-chain amino acid transport system substrate-binding protein